MQHDDHSMPGPTTAQPFWRSPVGIALIAFLVIAALLLGYEHRIHIFGGTSGSALFLVVWVGMHFLMHRGHGGHGGHRHRSGHNRTSGFPAASKDDQDRKDGEPR